MNVIQIERMQDGVAAVHLFRTERAGVVFATSHQVRNAEHGDRVRCRTSNRWDLMPLQQTVLGEPLQSPIRACSARGIAKALRWR